MATLELNSFKVVLVDPDRFYRAILREMLRSLRCWDIWEAPDADAAQALLDEDVDLLITEWAGPEGTAEALLKAVRHGQTGADPMLPIVGIMADTPRRNVVAARDAGTSELLAKPITMRRLFDRLEHAILAPRPFVQAASYVGPDRRRFTCSEYHGPDRRNGRDAASDHDLEAARRRAWPEGAPFVPPSAKLLDLKARAERPGIGISEAIGNAPRALQDLEHHHTERLAHAIVRLKSRITSPEQPEGPEALARDLGPPALDIASTAPVFGYTLAGDIAWMLRTLVQTLPLDEAPVLTMCRRLVETLRVTRDACVYHSNSPEGERILKELRATHHRLTKRYASTAAAA